MRLLLLRHFPVLAEPGLCYGRLDLPAEERTLATLQTLTGLPVFSSPAHRCLQLAQTLHPDPAMWPELQELDFGSWEGLRWDDIERAQIDAWAANIWHYRAGGGESAAMLRERWRCAVQKWRESRLEAAIVITHAGIIRMALAEQGLITEEARWNHPIAHGQIYEIEI